MRIMKNEISTLHFLCSVLGDENSALAFPIQIIFTVSGSRSPHGIKRSQSMIKVETVLNP